MTKNRKCSLTGMLSGMLGLMSPLLAVGPATAAEDIGLEEVVVTAQKRAENHHGNVSGQKTLFYW